VELLAVAGGLVQHAVQSPAAESSSGIVINLFWVLVAAGNFVVFFAVAWLIFFKPISARLDERRARLEQGLRDADAARQEREQSAVERMEALTEARREANDIVQRAQKAADDARERDLAATRAEIDRLRAQAAEEIESEKQRAIADVRAEIADLALLAAEKVVGETMNAPREQRLVEQFLRELPSGGGRTN